MRRALPLVVVFLLSLSAGLRAQSPYGSVRGYVYDEQAAVLPGATVTATASDVPGVFTATSDAAGLYRLVDLPPGVYTVAVELPGFAKLTRDPVIVRAGLNVLLDVEMKLVVFSEAVEVRAEPPLLESKQPVQAV